MATQPTILRLRLGRADHGRAVSSEEFAEAEFDEGFKYEREFGRLIVVAPSGGEDHIDCFEPFLEALFLYKKAANRNIVQRIVPEAWVRVDGQTDRYPDISVYLVPTGPVRKIPDRVPDLAIEVISPDKASRDRDYITRRSDYHRFGIKEYIIVDRFKKIVTVLTHQADGSAERTLTADQAYETPLLPGFAIRLSEVF